MFLITYIDVEHFKYHLIIYKSNDIHYKGNLVYSPNIPAINIKIPCSVTLYVCYSRSAMLNFQKLKKYLFFVNLPRTGVEKKSSKCLFYSFIMEIQNFKQFNERFLCNLTFFILCPSKWHFSLIFGNSHINLEMC